MKKDGNPKQMLGVASFNMIGVDYLNVVGKLSVFPFRL